MSAYNAPGASPIYAAARDLLAALDSGSYAATMQVGTLFAHLVDGGNYRALTLDDAHRIGRDTLATWATAFSQPADAWAVDMEAGGRVARLEWATDGEAPAGGGAVTWIGGQPTQRKETHL